MSEALDTWREKLAYFQEQEALTADPDQKFALARKVKEAKAKIVELDSQAQNDGSSGEAAFRADISRIVRYAPAELIGREAETKLLNDAWSSCVRQNAPTEKKPRARVLTFVALGGEGKTALVAKWAAELAGQDWPECEAAFAWSFYSQGTREQSAASSDLFLKEALAFFGDDADKAFAASPTGAFEKGQRLARIVGQRRSLLILDGLEPLQYASTAPTPGELKDAGLAALLKGLAAASHGLCVVTTRYSLPDLRAFRQTTAPEVNLLRLSRDAGVNLLKAHGVRGSDRKNIRLDGSKEMVSEFEKLVEDVEGHALTLHIMGSFLKKAFHGDIRQRDRVTFEKASRKTDDAGHAFRAMAAYAKWMEDGSDEAQRELAILRLMGLFDRPARSGCIQALLQEPAIPGLTEPLVGLAEEDWNCSLDALESARLLTVHRDAAAPIGHSSFVIGHSLDAHPLLREYFAGQLREQQPDAWRAAHRRLYEHLCASTPHKPQPTLEDLQPLYQAVAHGCQAGLLQETCEKVYCDRILHGTGTDGFYSIRKLGAFGSDLGAVACFFAQPWNRLSPALSEAAQPWLLNEAASCLRALGRLTEALEPMRASLEMRIKPEVWKSAAISASNLSELELTLGEVAGAVGDAEQSVTYADRSGDADWPRLSRTTHADALHQAGRRAEAETRFREAEQMQKETQPDYPLLYSLQGFRYCDLLLGAPERAAWQKMQKSEVRGQKSELIQNCRGVSQRAAQTLKWSTQQGILLDIALDHLTLGRASLYEAILAKSEIRNAKSEIDQAVAGLRRAGWQYILPLGLLTRAWLRYLTGACTGPESAQADLDEAWEIAERGPMKLFLADIHLTRARLFGNVKSEGGSLKEKAEYPWRSVEDDLAEARRLITTCGYGRRLPELADAEAALAPGGADLRSAAEHSGAPASTS